MTKTEIIAAVVANIGGRDDKDTVIRTGISLAIDDLVLDYDFRALKAVLDSSIVEGDSYVNLPTTNGIIHEVRFINGLNSYPLPLKNREQVLVDYPDADTLSTFFPRCAYIQGTQLFFAPRTSIDAVIRMTYMTTPTFASDDSELAPVVLGSSKYFIAYATAWVFDSMQMFQQGNAWMQRALMAKLSAQELDRRRPGEDRLKDPIRNISSVYLDPEDPFNGIAYGEVMGGPYGS